MKEDRGKVKAKAKVKEAAAKAGVREAKEDREVKEAKAAKAARAEASKIRKCCMWSRRSRCTGQWKA
jgi:hypothetical protein